MRRHRKINTATVAVIFIIFISLYIFSPDMRAILAEYGILPDTDTPSLSNDPGYTYVHVIDVGQGDSILLQNGDYNILVDAGPNSAEDELVEYLDALNIEKLDCVVLTHPHEDHIGGADAVLSAFGADTVLMPDCTSSSSSFERVLDIIEDKELSLCVPRRGDKFTLGALEFTVLAPGSESYEETNDYSIVLKAEHENISFMLTGDAEALSEYEILEHFDKDFLKCDLLKAGHHGSSSSSSAKFVKAVSPQYAAISCGLDNSYGHPHRETVSLFEKENIEYLRTDYEGSIIFVSDGSSIYVK